MVIIGSVKIGHWVLWKGMHIYTRTHRRGSGPAGYILPFPLGEHDLERDTRTLYGSHRAAGHLAWLKLLVCDCEVMKCKCSFSSPSGHKMWPYTESMEPFNLQTSSVSYAYIKMVALSPRGAGGFIFVWMRGCCQCNEDMEYIVGCPWITKLQQYILPIACTFNSIKRIVKGGPN